MLDELCGKCHGGPQRCVMDRNIRAGWAKWGGEVGKVVGWLGPACLVASLFATGSWAGEQVKVDRLLADPSSYNMKSVTVEGVVRNHRMEHFVGNVTGLEKCYQYFRLADETGAVNASYMSICKVGKEEAIILKEGDRVTAEGNFSGAGTGGGAVLIIRSLRKN